MDPARVQYLWKRDIASARAVYVREYKEAGNHPPYRRIRYQQSQALKRYRAAVMAINTHYGPMLTRARELQALELATLEQEARREGHIL